MFALLYTFGINHSKETLSREHKRSAYDHAERWTQYLETDPGRLDKFLACKVYQTKSPDQPEFLSKISEITCYELINFHGGLVNSGGLKPTKAYLEQIPKNLYNGFCVNIEFGIDYRQQSIITVEIPGILAEFVERGLNNILKAGELKNVNVSFLRAGLSSLDYEVGAHLAGTAADRYENIERVRQTIYGGLQ